MAMQKQVPVSIMMCVVCPLLLLLCCLIILY